MIKHINKVKTPKDNYLIDECLDLLRALSDKTRQQIIEIFAAKKEVCVSDIAKNFTLSRPTISHHLNLMKRAKLLNSRKAGKEIFYSFNRPYVTKLMKSIFNHLKKCC